MPRPPPPCGAAASAQPASGTPKFTTAGGLCGGAGAHQVARWLPSWLTPWTILQDPGNLAPGWSPGRRAEGSS